MRIRLDFFNISKNETLILKALAILIIMLHNYYRWLPNPIGENEFDFSLIRIRNFYRIIDSPKEFLKYFFNYFGHYGVQIFIIISAFGLTKSYDKTQQTWLEFVKHRYIKLYPSFIIGILFLLFYNIIFYSKYITGTDLKLIFYQLTTLNTLFPDKAFSLSGPWWFFSLIFQVYLIFPVLMYVFRRFYIRGLIVLIVSAFVFVISLYDVVLSLQLNILQTVLGHLPEVILGILFAKISSKKTFSVFCLLIPLAIFIAGNYSKTFWFFSHISVGILLLLCFIYVTKFILKFRILSNVFIFIGSISLYLFIIQGFVRWRFIELTQNTNSISSQNINSIFFVIVSIFIAYGLTKMENSYRIFVINGTTISSKVLRVFIPLLLAISLYIGLALV